VSERISGSSWPFVKTYNNSFIFELLDVEGSNKKLLKLGVSWDKFIDFIFWLILIVHVVC
jgi:hypothetical protein